MTQIIESNKAESLQTVQVDNLIAQAVNQGLPIEYLQGLMNLEERWRKEKARTAFFSALSAFQSECPDILKETNVSYKQTSYDYAELGDIDRIIKPFMFKHGLSKRWEMKDLDSGVLQVTCIITHQDGHSESTVMTSKKDDSGGKAEIHARASAVTYLQRYSLVLALGITTASKDDDVQQSTKTKTSMQSQQKSVNAEEYANLKVLLQSVVDTYTKHNVLNDKSLHLVKEYTAKGLGEADCKKIISDKFLSLKKAFIASKEGQS